MLPNALANILLATFSVTEVTLQRHLHDTGDLLCSQQSPAKQIHCVSGLTYDLPLGNFGLHLRSPVSNIRRCGSSVKSYSEL